MGGMKVFLIISNTFWLINMKLTAKKLWQMCLPENLLIVKKNFKKN